MNSSTRGELRRTIGLTELVFIGLVFIGPAAAVGVFGTLDARSGGAVALVYVIATIVMSFTAVSYMRMSREIPRAGTVFAYASAGIGPRTGFVAGWMILLDYLFIPSVAYLFTGIALNSIFPSVPVWVFTGVAVVVTTGLNLAGVKVASRVITLVVILEVLVLGLVLVLGIGYLAAHGPTRDWLSPLTGVDTFSMAAVLGAVSVAILSYLGFDSLATFAEEAKGGPRIVGRATLTCLIIAGVFFVAQTWVGSLLSPVTPAELRAAPEQEGAAYYSAVDATLGTWVHWLLAFAKGAGAAFSAMIGQAAGSRILMDMGRQGRVPRFLAEVSPRSGVPWKGVLVAAAGNVLVAGWATSRADGLDQLTSIVDVGALTAFVFVQASVVGYFLVKRLGGEDPSWFRHGLIPVVGGLLLILVLVNARPLALIIGAAWLLLGVLVYVVQSRRGALVAE
ncbi:amino acid/polyamine/organocation transporter (APC superfamily) [Brevibacterium sanguinis]|uniref:Amino acid/polyamine/organocation transporter (APC superfamily) n=2 Tax=Brevibacterium TaxID=1696 RepID=A0A366IQ14_9MICO|nr:MULTISPECIES: APC family permease [Brevibacterium]RBP67188.1 amino acid/polyamine/organocation transporter (APC superfamily) [Brevibacterium sanguinis]RBP73713.1 amino acid/polyamine/organocation transporter (APC superfamily) [Brevibacterium celere]